MKFSFSLVLSVLLVGIVQADWLAEYLNGSNDLNAVETSHWISAGAITPIGESSGSLSDSLGSVGFGHHMYGRTWLAVTPVQQLLPGLASPDIHSNSFSLTAEPDKLMNLTSVSFEIAGASNIVGRFNPDASAFGVALWYEDQGGTWQKIGEKYDQNFTVGFSQVEKASFDLSGIAALQNVSSVKFAFTALSNMTDPTGDKYAVCFSNIIVQGTPVELESIPEPVTGTLSLLGLAGLALFRRRI